MYVQGRCYKCGGFLAVDDTQDASVCPFCKKPFIVEKAIQSYGEVDLRTEDIRKTTNQHQGDFVVESGVLIHYNGYTKKEIRIPEGVAVIGESVFQGMNNIEIVHIPGSVMLISAGAFSGCRKLKEVHFSEGVEVIDREAFYGCTSLRSVRLPDSIKKMEAGAFAGCTSLETVSIPQKIEVLSWRVFEGCTGLKHIIIPKRVKTIEDAAFAECTALTHVEFACMNLVGNPSVGINRIGMNAFRNCTALEEIDLPESIQFIGNQAFRGCTKLKELIIPAGVKAIYPLAFADCSSLSSVVISKETELYRGGNPYKNAEDSATFSNCPNLLEVNFDGVTQHYWAFPAYMKAKEPVFMEEGRCRFCGGEFKGFFEKICAVCKKPKDY